MRISGIYKIVNRQNNKYYVGSSNHVNSRLTKHKSQLRLNNHPNPHLQAAWNKYGAENFDFTLIEESSTPKIREQDYLDIANQERDGCYNTTFIVDNPPRLTGERETLRRERLRNSANRAYLTNPDIKKQLRERTLLRFKDKASRIELSKVVRAAMKDPEKRKKISLATRDKNPYNFRNVKTGEVFIGTRIELRDKFGLKQDSMCSLMSGKRKSLKGWIVEK